MHRTASGTAQCSGVKGSERHVLMGGLMTVYRQAQICNGLGTFHTFHAVL